MAPQGGGVCGSSCHRPRGLDPSACKRVLVKACVRLVEGAGLLSDSVLLLQLLHQLDVLLHGVLLALA